MLRILKNRHGNDGLGNGRKSFFIRLTIIPLTIFPQSRDDRQKDFASAGVWP